MPPFSSLREQLRKTTSLSRTRKTVTSDDQPKLEPAIVPLTHEQKEGQLPALATCSAG